MSWFSYGFNVFVVLLHQNHASVCTYGVNLFSFLALKRRVCVSITFFGFTLCGNTDFHLLLGVWVRILCHMSYAGRQLQCKCFDFCELLPQFRVISFANELLWNKVSSIAYVGFQICIAAISFTKHFIDAWIHLIPFYMTYEMIFYLRLQSFSKIYFAFLPDVTDHSSY